VITCVERTPSCGSPSGDPPPSCPPESALANEAPSSVTWFCDARWPATEKPPRPLSESAPSVATTPGVRVAMAAGSVWFSSGSRCASSELTERPVCPVSPRPGAGRCARAVTPCSCTACVPSCTLAVSTSSSATRATVAVRGAWPSRATRMV